MLGTLCPVCQLAQKRCSGDALYQLMEWQLENLHRANGPEEECDAGLVEQCTCTECQHYAEEKELEKALERAANAPVAKNAQDPFYQGWTCP